MIATPIDSTFTRIRGKMVVVFYRSLAGLLGVALAFKTLKYYMYAHLLPRCTPKIFIPSTILPG